MYLKENYKIAFLILFLALYSCKNKVLEKPESVINAESMLKHVEVLASDDFQGRKPFTIGEQKTTQYLAKEFEKIGLKPLANGSYFQEVPMVQIDNTPSKKMDLHTKSGTISIE